MPTIVSRLPGAVIAAAGLFLLVSVIPNHTEAVDYGWVRPQTVPMLCGIALVLLGALQAVLPGGRADLSVREVARVALFVALTAGALFVMDRFGYLAGAAILALLVMLVVGERRPGWIALGAVAAPVVIWSIAVPLLGRVLP